MKKTSGGLRINRRKRDQQDVPKEEVGDGVALTSIPDPNFDEDGNCINPLMAEFLKTRYQPN